MPGNIHWIDCLCDCQRKSGFINLRFWEDLSIDVPRRINTNQIMLQVSGGPKLVVISPVSMTSIKHGSFHG